MKHSKITTFLCAGFLLLMAVGCGSSGNSSDGTLDVPKNETVTREGAADADSAESSSTQLENEENTDNWQNNADENQNSMQDSEEKSRESQEDNQAEGNNQKDNLTAGSQQENDSAGNNGAPTDNVTANIDASSQTDSELEGSVESIGDNSVIINKIIHLSSTTSVEFVGNGGTLVTVHFTDNTDYEVWTVRNSGINGDSDVDKQAGSFADIKEGNTLSMTGGYEGEEFYAEKVIIYRFV